MNKITYQLKISTSNTSNFSTIKDLFSSLNLKVKTISLPKKKKRFVLIKSPHVNKKSKEHFQIIRYRRLYHVDLSKKCLKDFLLKIPNDVEVLVLKSSRAKNSLF